MPEPTIESADEELALRARGGDDAAFAALIARYEQSAFNFSYRLLGDYDDAQDAAQAGFVELYLALPGLDLTRPVKPWLFRAIRNRCIDAIRRRRTVSLTAPVHYGEVTDAQLLEAQLVDEDPLPDELIERGDLQQLLAAAIRRLPDHYRDVVALRYTSDVTFGEVGEILGMPENTARIHFHRAKALLRDALRDLM